MANDRVHNNHKPSIHYNLESLIAEYTANGTADITENELRRIHRRLTARWNSWKLRHPDEPLVSCCRCCSGAEKRNDIKAGRWKVSTRKDQQEKKNLLSEID